jgi:DNA-binding GntR family transcriptional regulator
VNGYGRHPTAQEAVLAQLRRAIAGGRLRPGQQLVQDALAEQLGVSRVPLREALKILEGEGAVVYEPRRGYFVAELSLADLEEVYRIRDLLETEAVRVAVPRLGPDDLAALDAHAGECARAGRAADLDAMAEANRRLHFALIEASGMPRLARLARILWDATDVYRTVYYSEGLNRARVDEEHAAIAAAARAGDAERCAALLRAHREHAVAALRTLLA